MNNKIKNISLANKWRPKRFRDLLGHNFIKKFIKNSIKNKLLHHSYLINGPSGTGKTTFARIFSKALNCYKGVNYYFCNKCKFCKNLNKFKFSDYIEIDGSNNRNINNLENLLKNVFYKPIYFRYKIYVIDEFHMLNSNSFNLILKILEEPPKYIIFILITTFLEKIPETIVSRCVNLNFNFISDKNIILFVSKILIKNKIYYNKNSLYLICLNSLGNLRKSILIIQKLISFKKNITLKFIKKNLYVIEEKKILKLLFYLFKNYNFLILKFLIKLKKINFPIKNFISCFKNLINNIFILQYYPKILIKFKNKKFLIFLSKLINPEKLCLFYKIFDNCYNSLNLNYNNLIFYFIKIFIIKINFNG